MIKVDRDAIECVKGTLVSAVRSATNPAGLRIHIPTPSDIALEKAVMLAIQSLTMDTLNVRELAAPSDVEHVITFEKDFA